VRKLTKEESENGRSAGLEPCVVQQGRGGMVTIGSLPEDQDIDRISRETR
jgi:hypothetical protein